jgi:hypothetical protein
VEIKIYKKKRHMELNRGGRGPVVFIGSMWFMPLYLSKY